MSYHHFFFFRGTVSVQKENVNIFLHTRNGKVRRVVQTSLENAHFLLGITAVFYFISKSA